MNSKITVFTGAGISADSGLSTFRDSGGWWEKYDFKELASIGAWEEDPERVLAFYNERRQRIEKAEPNKAHLSLARLDKFYEVSIVTQNIDDLHERAGSDNVLHLHGLITKARSEKDPTKIVDIGYRDLTMGDEAADGGQLRPHVVWFGESVLNLREAVHEIRNSDMLIVVGTSLQVYPAAGLITEISDDAHKFVVDPSPIHLPDHTEWQLYREKAASGVPKLVNHLLENHNKI